ncbi:MAG: Methyl sulfide methyltransferase-associated sensor [Candidatus Methanogasteraceae archaeon]|nr:MAG: Methyl sulfide methyltransferase-associated sensor [ANME-2 cluster archaeon]
MRLQFRLILTLVAISTIPFGIIGYYTYDYSTTSMEDHARVHLNSVAQTRADYINSWLAQQMGTAKVIARTTSIVNDVMVIKTANISSDEYRDAVAEIAKFGDIIREESGTFDEAFMLDESGTVIASTNGDVIGDNRSSREYYREGLNQTHLTNVYESPTINIPTMLVSTPLIRDNRTIGVIVGRINLTTIHATVRDRKHLDETGRTYLVDCDSRLISGSTSENVTVLNSGRDYCGIYNRGGRAVIGAQVKISDPGWYLIVEQDYDEMLSALQMLLERAALVTIGVLMLISIFSVATTRQVTRPIRRLYEGAEEVARGNYLVQVPVVTDDEIGTLTMRFNSMVTELEETHRRLKDRIAMVNRDLENQRIKLVSVLQSMQDCVFATDNDFKITMFNKACEEFTGIAAEDAIGKLCHEVLLTDECEMGCHLRDSVGDCANGVCWEMYATDRSGRSVPIMTCGAPLRDADDAVIGYVEVLRDVTELKSVTDELRSANKELKKLDQLKTDFMNIASHELRTPLTSIRGFTEFVADGMLGDLNEKQKDALSRVILNSDRLLRLIANMLDISKIRSGKLELKITELDLSNLIKETVAEMELLAREKNVSCTVDIPDGIVIAGDYDRIEQVFVNLLSNAIKFTSEGGSVSVTAIEREGDDCVSILVSDTGIGIAPDDLEHVFEEFWQVEKGKGTGLGLMITTNIVREHGGTMWATSEVGSGSTFWVRLPRGGAGVSE